MVASIINSLGFGSGIDIPKLVSDLAAASHDPKAARFDAQTKAVQASISAVALARSDLNGFATSLTSLLSSGSLQAQPSVSDTSILDAKTSSGMQLGNVAGEVEVLSLARAQTLVSGSVANASDPVGQGTLTMTVGGVTHDVIIDQSNDSLTGLAKAINDAHTGITAAIVNDGGSARLLLKSGPGTASAFDLSAGATGALAGFAYPGSLQLVQSAQDATFKIDGLTYTRSSNVVTDVLPGVTLTLKKVATNQPVSLSVVRSDTALRSMLTDFVNVFNELKGHLNDASNATRSDQSLRSFSYRLGKLLTTPLSSGYPASLSQIGLSTNRNGTIALDEAAFARAFANNPSGVEALFVPTRDANRSVATDPGIGGALNALQSRANAPGGMLDALTKRLTSQADRTSAGRAAMEAAEEAYKQRLTKSYSTVDSRLSALKATQSYLDQQIKMWTSSQ